MLDILAMLCLPGAPATCALRAIPVAGETCAAAMEAASGRLADWKRSYQVAEIRCGASGARALDFEEVRPGLFLHRGRVALAEPANGGNIANIAFVIGSEAVAVIDSGGSRALGEATVAAVREATDLPIRYLVLTHYHPDHVFGATALADAGAEILAHARLWDALAVRSDSYLEQGRRQVGPTFIGSAVPAVDRAVTEDLVLDLGGRRLELRAWPVSHSEADVTVLDPTTRTLLAGDLVFGEHLPTLDGSILGWFEVLGELAGLEARHVVPGHGGPLLPWPEGGAAVRRYLDVLAGDVRALLGEGATISETVERAARAEGGAWDLFDLHNPRNATAAYTELEWE